MKIDNLDEKLIKAVEKGNLGTAFEMLKRGANPNADKGMPLYLAIKQKNANMIQLLLNSGASIIESSERLQTLQNDKNYQKNKNEINLLKLYKEKKYNIKEDIKDNLEVYNMMERKTLFEMAMEDLNTIRKGIKNKSDYEIAVEYIHAYLDRTGKAEFSPQALIHMKKGLLTIFPAEKVESIVKYAREYSGLNEPKTASKADAEAKKTAEKTATTKVKATAKQKDTANKPEVLVNRKESNSEKIEKLAKKAYDVYASESVHEGCPYCGSVNFLTKSGFCVNCKRKVY